MECKDWISCAKLLPPVKQYVLCWIWDDYYIGYLETGENEWHFEEFDLRKEDDNFDDVEAWVPLPKPYNEAKKDLGYKKKCICETEGLEGGDTLYYHTSWDGGEEYNYIRPIKYCPICGKKLPSYE